MSGRDVGTQRDNDGARRGFENEGVFRIFIRGHIGFLSESFGAEREARVMFDGRLFDEIHLAEFLRQIGVAFLLQAALVGTGAARSAFAVRRKARR